MGFTKSMVAQEFPVSLRFEYQQYEDAPSGGPPLLIGTTSAEVTHIFRLPSVEEREEYHRRLVRTKGKKVVSGASDAAVYLWSRCCIRVSGYDDLPSLNGNWKVYFDDEIGRIHVEEAVDRFMGRMSAEEVETTKKSAPSSVQS